VLCRFYSVGYNGAERIDPANTPWGPAQLEAFWIVSGASPNPSRASAILVGQVKRKRGSALQQCDAKRTLPVAAGRLEPLRAVPVRQQRTPEVGRHGQGSSSCIARRVSSRDCGLRYGQRHPRVAQRLVVCALHQSWHQLTPVPPCVGRHGANCAAPPSGSHI
jgi:hypothetical protein